MLPNEQNVIIQALCAAQGSRNFYLNPINTLLANQEDDVFVWSQVRGLSTLKCTIWSCSDSQKRKQLSC